MAVMAGIDLLGKFLAGSDKGSVGKRFCRFLEDCFNMRNTHDRETIHQLRNSLVHSFGLYSEHKGTVYHFVLTESGSSPLVSTRPDDRYVVDVRVLHCEFEKAIEVYRTKLDRDAEWQKKFTDMFSLYGCVPIQ